MSYFLESINYYQGYLIAFMEGCLVEQANENEPVKQLVPLISMSIILTPCYGAVLEKILTTII